MKPVSALQGANAYLPLALTPPLWACNMIVGRGPATDVPSIAMTCSRCLTAIAVSMPFARPHVWRDWPLVRRSPFRQEWADRGLGAMGTTTK